VLRGVNGEPLNVALHDCPIDHEAPAWVVRTMKPRVFRILKTSVFIFVGELNCVEISHLQFGNATAPGDQQIGLSPVFFQANRPFNFVTDDSTLSSKV